MRLVPEKGLLSSGRQSEASNLTEAFSLPTVSQWIYKKMTMSLLRLYYFQRFGSRLPQMSFQVLMLIRLYQISNSIV